MVNTDVDKYHKNIPLGTVLNLRYKENCTLQQIADRYHSTPQAIHERIKRFESIAADPERVKSFKEYEMDLQVGLRERIFSSIQDSEIEKAPFQTKIWAYGVLFDKSQTRKDTGELDYNSLPVQQVTQNIQININKLAVLVGRLPVDLRDQVSKLIPQSLVKTDNLGELVK